MALILARTASIEELRDSLWAAGINPSGLSDIESLRAAQDLSEMKDKDLLLNTAIELVDFQYLEDAVQNRTLLWLNEVAGRRPAVVMHLWVLDLALLTICMADDDDDDWMTMAN
jgi:neurofibromin 1